jgi:hypothetical protein
MIASVYIKDGNIVLYNDDKDFSALGGISCPLGKPLLAFLCYEKERFDEAFSGIASAFEVPGAEVGMHDAEFKAALRESLTEMQLHEPYVYFYNRALIKSVYAGRPPREVFGALSDDFRQTRAFAEFEIANLLMLREKFPDKPPMEYLYMLDLMHERDFGSMYYLNEPFKTYYGLVQEPEIAEFYEIDTVRDLLRFELLKMIEHNIFIKKCKNCGWFFIPSRRADAEYCDRAFGETGRKCSEIGATLRYEKKVSENPVWEVYKRNYRRQNSRTRAGKMTQAEFLQWSEQAAGKRDECLAGSLPFDEYAAWLDRGRIRKPRQKKEQDAD